jgi:hypothetical protein
MPIHQQRNLGIGETPEQGIDEGCCHNDITNPGRHHQ